MTADRSSSYDQIPYESYPYPQSHPDRLATIGSLFGLAPAPVDRCRVLELGSAAGGNLVPMAARLPESEFVGVDLSSRQIEQGQKVVQALGLTNCRLICQDLTTLDAGLGTFDYILCHGVWSWVPEAARRRILELCKALLADRGIGFISYNTYPGWHFRGIIRDLMAYRTRDIAHPLDRIAEARKMVDFLARSVPEEKHPYGMLLRSEAETLRTRSDSYLAHEHLEENNHPVYFHEFAELAMAAGLQYVGEADLSAMTSTPFGPEAGQYLGKIARTVIEYEQYLDFLRNRAFRQTLLCHQGLPINRNVDAERIVPLRVASSAIAAEPYSVRDASKARFQTVRGTLSTPSPLFKAAMKVLVEAWPRSIPFPELAESVRTQLHGDTPLDDAVRTNESRSLGANLIDCFGRGFVDLFTCDPGAAAEVEPRPLADPLVLLQAAHGPMAYGRLHSPVKLSDLQRQVVLLCDGQTTPAEIAATLAEMISKGTLTVRQEGEARTDTASLRPQLEEAVDKTLAFLVRHGLLVPNSEASQDYTAPGRM